VALGVYFKVRPAGIILKALLQEVATVKEKRLPVICAAVLFSAILISGCARQPAQSGALETGRPAPAFKLPDINGRQLSLDQYKGKVVLLDFWATWCGPCRMTMPVLESLQKEYPDRLVLLAINLQEPKEAVQEYIRQQNLKSQVLLDEQGTVGSQYGADAIPMQVLIDKAGIVRDVLTGYNPRMAKRLREEITNLY
jgi:thiol-disulfide isomerase/thioredoxin